MSQARPLFQYQEIARQLREQILRGDFHADGRLPSERLLVERFQVQRNTVRQALALLEREGQIVTEGKRGSFIRLSHSAPTHKTFLVSIHSSGSSNLTQLMDGFTEASSRAGYAIRRFDTHPRQGAALDRVPHPDRLPPDAAGVVLWPHNPTNSEMLNRLNEALPLVLVDRRVLGVSTDCVRFDDVTGGKVVTEHLLSQGHRRIIFLADEVFAETVEHRWHGYLLALETHGVPVDPRLSLFLHGIDAPYFALAMRYLLSLEDRPTAVVCSNDLVAFMLLRFLRDEGLRVPDDVAVTGYGNTVPDYTEAMALTSVDQPFHELGQAAANILVGRAGQAASERLRDPLDITIPVRLVVRGSSNSG